MKIKNLTRKQVENMYGFCHNATQVLRNGETGYCKATHTLVTCCGNCGDYTHVHAKLNGLKYKT